MSSTHASAIAPQSGDTQRTACEMQHVRYDALVSINVPSDKARAVVDAMERDMGTTLATKQDLDALRLATKQDLLLLKQDFVLLRQELRQDIQLLRQDVTGTQRDLKQQIDMLRSDMSRDLAAQDLKMTVKLG